MSGGRNSDQTPFQGVKSVPEVGALEIPMAPPTDEPPIKKPPIDEPPIKD